MHRCADQSRRSCRVHAGRPGPPGDISAGFALLRPGALKRCAGGVKIGLGAAQPASLASACENQFQGEPPAKRGMIRDLRQVSCSGLSRFRGRGVFSALAAPERSGHARIDLGHSTAPISSRIAPHRTSQSHDVAISIVAKRRPISRLFVVGERRLRETSSRRMSTPWDWHQGVLREWTTKKTTTRTCARD